MKFRWKILLMLLILSILPAVSLRIFGITTVRMMADSLTDQIQQHDNPIEPSIQAWLSKVQNYTATFLGFLILTAIGASLWFAKTITRPLALISSAATKLSEGDFETRVSITSGDEFQTMGEIFNTIGPQLKEHYRMRRSLEVAEEIQRNLLPANAPEMPGLDIHGMTLFSDQTGGDYFDYICVDGEKKDKLCVVVGDVAGHGIPTALLMATARGFLHFRTRLKGPLESIVSDVNREFARDVDDSGQFMTMLLARIDLGGGQMEWVRAGHDPAMLYDGQRDEFVPMAEKRGLPLGISADTPYEKSSCKINPGQIIFLGTDGIWEARNPKGELFGKSLLQQIIRENRKESARAIALSIIDAVEDFRGQDQQEDDLTLVIIKVVDL
jgi:sigma-B regulation protein RsbU (phosphoserine phosphatase)